MDNLPEQIDVVLSPEGSKRWVLLRRPDGLHSYSEHSLEDAIYWVDEDGGERDVAAPERWTRTYQSGLFDSEDVARSNSFDRIPWLFAAIL
ncbi:hypothetical protein [Sphingomonas sp. BAUL-RG-20F-R05-02]|uniref:hypothetical protein n=1 Tax=Sphingomonas sp. BAUL-RG-20F-R05-02 TaxID=2914830 RepID=UPI001F5996AE|nr:hypothetical protein [Sphingomonas sp. BAUL-RG-20F-R05-02]